MEIDGVGAPAPGAAERVRVEDLHRERFPPAGRAAGQHPRPRLRDDAEAALELGDQLLDDRVAVRADVRRVHRVRRVVVRVRVADRHRDHAWRARREPEVAERAGAGRCVVGFAEVERRAAAGEVALEVDHRVARARVLVVVARQQHVRADVHVAAPELGDARAPDLDELHQLAVLRVALVEHAALGHRLDRQDHAAELERDDAAAARVEPHALHRAVRVPRRPPQVLPLARLVVHLECVAVRAVVRRVDVEERLDVVLARREVRDARERVALDALRFVAEHHGQAGREVAHVQPVERDAGHVHLLARLAGAVPREHDEDAAGDRDLEPERCDRLAGLRGQLDLEARRGLAPDDPHAAHQAGQRDGGEEGGGAGGSGLSHG